MSKPTLRSDLDRQAAELRDEGLTYVQIAERLGVTPAMARRRVIRFGKRTKKPLAVG